MHDQVANVLSRFFSGDALKGAVISGVIAIGGYFWHDSVTRHDQDNTLNLHTQQIAEISQTLKETSTAVQTLNVTTARMEGTVNTINQKIDDDRRQNKIENLEKRGRN